MAISENLMNLMARSINNDKNVFTSHNKHTIRHIKRSTKYLVAGFSKVKVDGAWVLFIKYVSLEKENFGEEFHRLPNDFNGFENISRI